MNEKTKRVLAHRACTWLVATGLSKAALSKRINRTPASVAGYMRMENTPSDDVLAALLALVRTHARNLAMVTNSMIRPDAWAMSDDEKAAAYVLFDRVVPAVNDLHASCETVASVKAEADLVAAQLREFRERTGRDLFSNVGGGWGPPQLPEE